MDGGCTVDTPAEGNEKSSLTNAASICQFAPLFNSAFISAAVPAYVPGATTALYASPVPLFTLTCCTPVPASAKGLVERLEVMSSSVSARSQPDLLILSAATTCGFS